MDKTTSANKDSANLLRALSPFVASFGFRAHDTEPARICTSSCFFIVLNGHWVMCTAAHVADEIKQLQENGVKLTDWHVNDGFTRTTSHFVYPFDITTREQFYLRNDTLGLDYLLVYVESLAARSMYDSGLRALDRSLTGYALEANKWVLTGFPSEFSKAVGSSRVAQRHYLVGVTPIERPSAWMPGRNEDSLFGRLEPMREDLEVGDIGGMSGGPIFGIYPRADGMVDVKLVAVQSGWNSRTRVITACPVADFMDALEQLINDGPLG